MKNMLIYGKKTENLRWLKWKINLCNDIRKIVLLYVIVILTLFSGCGVQRGTENYSNKDTVEDNTDKINDIEEQDDETGKLTLQDYSTEDFHEIEPYLGYFLESLYSSQGENADPKKMGISEQIGYLDPYVEKKFEEGQMNDKILEINGVRGVVLAKEEIQQILYSISGTEYDDDLSYDLPEYDGFYIFEETINDVNQLESAVIMADDDKVTVTAKLYMPRLFEYEGVPNVVVTMVPNKKSEFGLCVDEVRFSKDGAELVALESEANENESTNDVSSEIIKYVPPEDSDLEAGRQQVMQRLLAEANEMEEDSNDEMYSNEELANMALEYYLSLNGDEYRDVLDVLVHEEYDENGRVPIQILENMPDHTVTYTWYYVDPYTAEGEDFFGEYVDLKEVV